MKYTLMKYLRISLEDIDLDGMDKYESDSIQNQRAYLDDFIARTPEFDGCEILEALDDGRTGTNFNRPGVQRVIELAQSGKIQCVIVKDLSRWGRNYIDVGDFLEQKFPAWGVRFISLNDMYDSATLNGATGGIDIAFRNLIYELYSRDLSEKVKSARISAAKSGKVITSYAPHGYTKDPNDKRKLIIDSAAADVIKLIYNLAEQGMSLTQIARKLNADGIPTPQQHKVSMGAKRTWLKTNVSFWDDSILGLILKDERYTGIWIFGKKRVVDVGKTKSVRVPESDWIVVPDGIPQIITPEQFKAVREIIGTRTVPHLCGYKKSESLFAKKLKCGNCGHALRANRNNGNTRYYCNTRLATNDKQCFDSGIGEGVIAGVVLNALQQQIKLALECKKLRRANVKSAMPTIANLRGEIQDARRVVDKSKTAKMSLWEKYHSGAMSREQFQRESGKFTAQTMEAENRITELETQVQALEAAGQEENEFEDRFSRQVGITELTYEVVQEFIKVVKVYTPDRIEVVFNYADEFERNAETLNQYFHTEVI